MRSVNEKEGLNGDGTATLLIPIIHCSLLVHQPQQHRIDTIVMIGITAKKTKNRTCTSPDEE